MPLSRWGNAISGARQINTNDGALADLAFDRDRTASLLGKGIHHAQSKPGTLSGLFGREERLEGLAPDLLAHAAPVVAHRDHDVIAWIEVGRQPCLPSSKILACDRQCSARC